MKNDIIKPYRMKHVPTGLYYQPHKYRGSHLSVRGKVYFTQSNGISYEKSGKYKTVNISCERDSRIYKTTKDKINWKDHCYCRHTMVADTEFFDWTKEEIQIN